jgi:hypothetical protein
LESDWTAVEAGDCGAVGAIARPLAWIKEEPIREDVIDEALDLDRWRNHEERRTLG